MLRGVSISKQNRFARLAPNHQLLCFRPSHASCVSTKKAVNISKITVFKETRAQVVYPTRLLLFECYVVGALELVFAIHYIHLTTIYIVLISGTVVNVKGKGLSTYGTN